MAASVAGLPDTPSAATPMAGGGASAGAVVSRTVTEAVALAKLPKRSVALKVTTVVVFSANIAGASLVRTGTAAVSVARARASQPAMSELPRGEPAVCVASTVMSAGGVTVIVVVAPTTVTIELELAVLPDASVAVQVTVVVPPGKTAGASLVTIRVGAMS